MSWLSLRYLQDVHKRIYYPVSGTYSFYIFHILFLQDTPDTKWKLSCTCGDVWQVSMEWKREGILFPVLLQLKKKARNLSSIFLQSQHFRAIVSGSVQFSCLLYLLAGSHTLVLISEIRIKLVSASGSQKISAVSTKDNESLFIMPGILTRT